MSTAPKIIRIGNKTVYRTGSAFEKLFGYCRAVRKGPMIAVSGTTAAALPSDTEHDPGDILYPGDAYKQAELAMTRSVDAVVALGGTPEDIMRVRMFVADATFCPAVGEAIQAVFGLDYDGDGRIGKNQSSGVAATMIVVPGGFVDGGMLVEVEIEAYVS